MTDEVRLLQWTLDNIFTIARRESLRHDPGGRWAHVLRLCEKAGCQGRGVLRDNSGPLPGAVSDEVSAVDPGASERPQERVGATVNHSIQTTFPAGPAAPPAEERRDEKIKNYARIEEVEPIPSSQLPRRPTE